MDLPSALILISVALVLFAVGAGWSIVHRRRLREDAASHARSIEEERHIPPSLHPVIDANVCIGSLSCIKACPEGDILGIVKGTAALIEGANCIGHGRCAVECPVNAIKLVFGSSERGVDLPEVDENFQSSRPGVFIAGELGGMGLIKNAIAQGLEAGAQIGETLSSSPAPTGVLDAVIVGAGPAGIAAAISLRQAGRTFRIIEQQKIGGSVAQYPRQKIVMTERAQIPGFGAFGKTRMSKEELLDGLQHLISHFHLEIEEGTRLIDIAGDPGAFRVRTDKGEILAQRVVLAIGRRGTPRRIEVPGEQTAKVTYGLLEPEQYSGKRVLVVGGGDSATEAALTLAEGSDAVVSIMHRGPELRGRLANREAISQKIASGRIQALMSTRVAAIEAERVIANGPAGSLTIDNDFVIICAGGELPLELLKTCAISLKRHVGDQPIAPPVARPWRQKGLGYRATAEVEEARTQRFHSLLLILGLTILGALSIMGRDYYLLSQIARAHSPLHASLKPSGPIGHGIGLVASGVLLSNFMYALRKRWKRLKGAAPIARWLSFHVFVGIMSPIVIAFHAAFQWNNAVATSTFLSLSVVVATGLAGRFAYGLIPSVQGKAVALGEISGQLERVRADAYVEAARSSDPTRLRQLIKTLTSIETESRPLAELFFRHPRAALRTRWQLFQLRGLFSERGQYAAFHRHAVQITKMKTEIEFWDALRRFLGWWRVVHVMLAILLVLVMSIHIGISLYVGYGWSLFQ